MREISFIFLFFIFFLIAHELFTKPFCQGASLFVLGQPYLQKCLLLFWKSNTVRLSIFSRSGKAFG